MIAPLKSEYRSSNVRNTPNWSIPSPERALYCLCLYHCTSWAYSHLTAKAGEGRWNSHSALPQIVQKKVEFSQRFFALSGPSIRESQSPHFLYLWPCPFFFFIKAILNGNRGAFSSDVPPLRFQDPRPRFRAIAAVSSRSSHELETRNSVSERESVRIRLV